MECGGWDYVVWLVEGLFRVAGCMSNVLLFKISRLCYVPATLNTIGQGYVVGKSGIGRGWYWAGRGVLGGEEW